MRALLPGLTLALLLAGCSGATDDNADATDNAVAAANEIDTGELPPAPANVQATGVAATPLSNGAASAVVAEPEIDPDSAQGAAQVVQRYFALIEAGRYGEAWQSWSEAGAASGMTQSEFADSFAKYAEYHAEIGAPGRIDSGAGQRYVTVPVRAYGKLKDGGRAFNMAGDVTLHRTADIDGATAAQRSWHITNTDLKLRPASDAADADTPDMPVQVTAQFRCVDGTAFTADFDNEKDIATLLRDGKEFAVLAQQRAASGIHYRSGEWNLRGKGRQVTLTRNGKAPVPCTSR